MNQNSANYFSSSLSIYNSLTFPGHSLFQTVAAFVTHSDQHRFSPCFQTLLTFLPPLRLPGCQPDQQPSGFPTLYIRNHVVCATSLHVYPSLRLPRFPRFQYGEIPKPVTYPDRHIINLPISIHKMPMAHNSSFRIQLTIAPSVGAFTRLSCPKTPNFLRCRNFQVSPQPPAVFLRPHKPTCGASVTPSRTRRRRTSTTLKVVTVFTNVRYYCDHFLSQPVSVSPNPFD